ncbi:hypothetical protein GCM10023306_04380 [Novosphingobium ginsenosidimutans]|jgi:hypothetical protein|uniref:Uncharacterized protein n=2 Tax=Novosphingobium ginsenosidimutans TaxID=1176536 RepID=A0A5B8S2A0_9SPHN|nr:hypothetical protein FRF71_05145 [Novosphingobium ginsenosidimutans]
MNLMIKLSLALNILVLVPVCGSLLTGAGWTLAAYGPASPARGILLSIYLAILVVSVGLLFKPVPAMVAALLIVQIVYKVTTPFTVGTIANPVVLSNLAIAAVHAATVATIFQAKS